MYAEAITWCCITGRAGLRAPLFDSCLCPFLIPLCFKQMTANTEATQKKTMKTPKAPKRVPIVRALLEVSSLVAVATQTVQHIRINGDDVLLD